MSGGTWWVGGRWVLMVLERALLLVGGVIIILRVGRRYWKTGVGYGSLNE